MEPRLTAVLDRVVAWAAARPDVRGVALVGSHARDEARDDSDLDLVLLCERPSELVEDDAWARELGGTIVATREWGVVTERRVSLGDALPELDAGVAALSWAHTDPVDPGTARVARDGLRALHDPDERLRRLLSALWAGRGASR
ncbi:MAG TPA: aminoglycoside 6-adenylyltransferase [Solirubrobacteraceae bacterium]|nr:aminoglycoside 6-adenylyltransferase [Solirubrobacteraceae bacterium]